MNEELRKTAGLNKMKNEKWRINNYFKRKNYSLFIINYKFKYAVAFTLAEVLITLGIIGVVAAMTIPTLVAKYQQNLIENRAKKAYSMIAQAVQMSVAENGSTQYWDQNLGTSDLENSKLFTQKYLLPYLKAIHVGDGGMCGYGGVVYRAHDNTQFAVCKYLSMNDYVHISIMPITKNSGNINLEAYIDMKTGRLMPSYYDSSKGLNDYLNGYQPDNASYTVACNKDSNAQYPLAACFAFLYYNNWTFGKYYPY